MKKTFKYQERVAEKLGFEKITYKNGVRIYSKWYATREAALNDKENIKKAINALRTYNSGKVISGIGTVICDKQYGKCTFENPHLGWSSYGSETFLELIK